MKYLFVTFLLLSSSVNAGLLTYNFTGNINETNEALLGVAEGDKYYGSITLDSSQSYFYFDGTSAEYPSILSSTFTIGNFTFQSNNSDSYESEYYGPKRTVQLFDMGNFDSVFLTTGIDFEHDFHFGTGNTGVSVRLSMYDWTGTAFDDEAIDKLTKISTAGFQHNFLEIIAEDFSNRDNDFILRASLEKFELVSVPSPPPHWLFGLGMFYFFTRFSRLQEGQKKYLPKFSDTHNA